MRSLIAVSFCVAALILLIGTGGRSDYPDGPFSVQLLVDGRGIAAGSEIQLSSHTNVVEYYAAGAYMKSPGTTYWDGFSVVAPASSDLDNWFSAGGEKDVYLRIRDGRDATIEAWMLYRVVLLSREPLYGGDVRYSFGTNSIFERDREVVPPA